MNPEPINDEQISAWVDGELGADARRRVEAWLHEHPEDATRARLWQADREALHARLAPLAAEPVPQALAARLWRGQHGGTGPRWALAASPAWALAASVTGLLVVGALAGGGAVWQWQQQAAQQWAAGTPQGWVQRAALAHSVYVPEPRHAVEVGAQEEHLARWLTSRIGFPVKLFDLRAQGFELVGGRLLPDGPGKSAQLMYQGAQGMRVTVYLRKPEAGADAAFRYQRQGEQGMFYWVEAGAGYALVGALPQPTLLALAQAIYQQRGSVAAAAQ